MSTGETQRPAVGRNQGKIPEVALITPAILEITEEERAQFEKAINEVETSLIRKSLHLNLVGIMDQLIQGIKQLGISIHDRKSLAEYIVATHSRLTNVVKGV